VFVEISFTEKDLMNLTAALRVWTWVESGALLLRHVAMSKEMPECEVLWLLMVLLFQLSWYRKRITATVKSASVQVTVDEKILLEKLYNFKNKNSISTRFE
jgi:hypothetical protein